MSQPLDLAPLFRQGLLLLRLSGQSWATLRRTRHQGARFSWTMTHESAEGASARTPILIAIDGPNPELRLGWLRSVAAVATLTTRLSLDSIQPVQPASLVALLAQITASPLKAPVAKLRASTREFEPVSDKLGRAMLTILAETPSNLPVLKRMIALIQRPKTYRDARSLEIDAVATAVKLFGGSDAAATLALGQRPTALATARLMEDVVIEHDARWAPGWTLDESDLTGRATFTKDKEVLTVYTANKQPLEQLFGVDLIYLNARRGALVMVQYKLMEPGAQESTVHAWEYGQTEVRGEREWLVPINDQFQAELSRMQTFTRDLAPNGPFRMTPNPFFLKLVKRHAALTSSGVLLHLDHFQQLLAEGDFAGPRGGLRIAYKTLDGHYLRGEGFVELVRSGYVGTRGATTQHLQTLIEVTLQHGRAAVAAIQEDLETPKP